MGCGSCGLKRPRLGRAGYCIPPFAAMLEEKRSPCGRGAPRPTGPRGGRGAVVARALRAQEKRLHVFSFGYMYRFPRDLHIDFICFSITCIHFWLHVFSLRYMYSVSVTCIQPVFWGKARKRRSRTTCSAVTGAPPCVLRGTIRKKPKCFTARNPGSLDTAIVALLAAVRASISARISAPQLTSRSAPTGVNPGAGLTPRAAASGHCRGFRAIRCAMSAPFQATRRVLFRIVTRSTPAPTRKAALAKPKKWIALPRAIRPHRRLRAAPGRTSGAGAPAACSAGAGAR